MMEKCFDEATLQAFLDNELEQSLSQKVARHLVDCDPCAFLLAEVEEETAFAFAALEQEFGGLVPTQRLWTKINESIEVQHRKRSLWQNVLAFFSGLSFTNPHVVAFGSLLLIVGVVSTLILVKNDNLSNNIADIKQTNVPPIQIAQNDRAPIVTPQIDDSSIVDEDLPVADTVRNDRINTAPQYTVQKASYVEPNRKPQTPTIKTPPVTTAVVPQYLDGEESYVTTIARLEQNVNQRKDEVLTGSSRFAYEKDMAVVNDTISKMKREVRRNPKNKDAKQVLFSSYQNKIELLNSVTQRSELMASLRD